MNRLKTAKSAIKRATDSLVKAAQDSIRQEEEAPVAIKADIFKEVMYWTNTRSETQIFTQRIDAEARVLKLEKEVRDAKTVLKQLKQLPLRSVGDIKRVMFCRNYLMYLILFTRVVSELHMIAGYIFLDARCGGQSGNSSEKSPGCSGFCLETEQESICWVKLNNKCLIFLILTIFDYFYQIGDKHAGG